MKLQRLNLRNFLTLTIGTLAILLLGGCSNQFTPIYESANAATLAVNSATTLLQSHSIDTVKARDVYVAGEAVESALKVWQTAVDGQSTPAATLVADQNAVVTALGQVVQALANVQSVQAKAGRLAAGPPVKTTAKTAAITPAEVANILALVLELEPSLVGEVDAIFTGATATDAQVTQAIADLDVANNALLAAINGATTKAA